MFFRRLYDERLAQASYLIGCQTTGEALVVDPNRRVEQYLGAAQREGLRVAHVTETHIHADFVSGARELAHRAGARLYLSGMGGPGWQYAYAADAGAELLQDGGCMRVGRIEVSVVHTPGHTPEHLAFVVADTAATREPMGALTGDFLFVGDVGRPDLLEKAAHEQGTMIAGARQLFASLQRFRALPDYLQIWPGHGAGSACGKALGAVPQSTLGYEKRTNWAFGITDEEEFVRAVLEGQPDPPRYFAMMKRINRDGPALLASSRPPGPLSPDRLEHAIHRGAVIVDTRDAREYARGAVPGTVNIPWNRSFTNWAGWLLPYDRDVYLIADAARAPEIPEMVRELSGIGLDRVSGFFDDEVLEASRKHAAKLETIGIVDADAVTRPGTVLIDVRGPGEFAHGHIPGARNIPLGDLPARLEEIPRNRPVVVHCQSGARAAIAASLLKANGFRGARLFPGGFGEWRDSGRPVE
jgi:hydroxyacylglutathione hydrolase